MGGRAPSTPRSPSLPLAGRSSDRLASGAAATSKAKRRWPNYSAPSTARRPKTRQAACSTSPTASVASEKITSSTLIPLRKRMHPSVASTGMVGPSGRVSELGPRFRRSTSTARQVGTYCANTAALFRSESRSKSAKAARPAHASAVTAIASDGVPNRALVRAKIAGSSPFSPSAERYRGVTRATAVRYPNEETTDPTATNPPAQGPANAPAASASGLSGGRRAGGGPIDTILRGTQNSTAPQRE